MNWFQSLVFVGSYLLSVIQGVPLPKKRELQLVGNVVDDHGCYFSAGYQWCESSQSCYRPWETSCETDTSLTKSNLRCANGFCENPQDCPRCPPTMICEVDGFICAGTCYGTCVPLPPPPLLPPPPPPPYVIDKIPSDCQIWYDGCNTCTLKNGKKNGCTRKMCFQKGTPHCQLSEHR